jgi:hypothetical protein
LEKLAIAASNMLVKSYRLPGQETSTFPVDLASGEMGMFMSHHVFLAVYTKCSDRITEALGGDTVGIRDRLNVVTMRVCAYTRGTGLLFDAGMVF